MAHIMIAEHNKAAATYMYKALKQAGNTITITDNALDSWATANGHDDYDIMMIDVVMPGLDGFVLAQKALQENPGLQIIFITGFAAVAMDTYNTPSYAPQPMTSRPFHLKDITARVRYMMGEADMPTQTYNTPNTSNNNIVYAEFGQKKTG
jgi:two-component system cell cycle response regulator CpdR